MPLSLLTVAFFRCQNEISCKMKQEIFSTYMHTCICNCTIYRHLITHTYIYVYAACACLSTHAYAAQVKLRHPLTIHTCTHYNTLGYESTICRLFNYELFSHISLRFFWWWERHLFE